jgi:allantoinase
MVDLAVINGVVVSPATTLQRASVLVQNGKIQSIEATGEHVAARQTLDAEGMLVLPGAIDIHFHCRAPSFPERGDFATESRAAAAGGVTTIFEMPISKPCCATTEVWHSRRDLATRDAYVNIGLYGAPGLLDAKEINGMAEAGAIGFKLFTTQAAKGREDEFRGLTTNNLADIVRALELIQPTGLRCVFHAEDQSLIDLYTARARTTPMPDVKRHERSRPAIVEATAVASLLAIVSSLDTPIHIAHVSSKRAVELLRDAKTKGLPVTAETCPHYLFFTDEVLEQVGPYGKINPPLRHEEDREALWEGLLDGTLDVVATDHAPFTSQEKEAAWNNILEAPPGHPGVEFLLPLMLSEALKGRLSLLKAVELISTKPAQLFNLYPQKGTLWPGADADITLYDPRPTVTVDRTKGFSRAAECNRLYDGMKLQGEVFATIVGGKVIYQEGRVIGSPSDGKIVTPQRSHDVTAILEKVL